NFTVLFTRRDNMTRLIRSIFRSSFTRGATKGTPARRRTIRQRLLVQPLEDRTVPNTYTVSNLNDSGAGSLRQAILDANANAGADIIDATGVTGTITLTTELTHIRDDVTLNGPGSAKLTVTRGGAAQFRIMTIDNSGTANIVNISGITLT